jgi:ketosteroid isomerase-like protein
MSNETQIKSLIENWAAAVRNKDIDAILANHSADIVMYDVPFPFMSVGIEAYRETWDLFFKYARPEVFDIQQLDIVADENVAFCYAKMLCSDKSDTIEFADLYFRLTIGLKKINNEWTIVHEHHSVPSR